MRSAPVTRAWIRRAVLRGRPTSRPWRTTIHSPSVLSPAPPIISRCVGPHSVTSSPNRACQIASSGNPISATEPHTSITTPPGLSRSRSARIRRSPRPPVPAEDPVQERREDDALEAEDDQQVRDREDGLVAAVVDVVADVPVHAEDRDLEREAAEQRRRGVARGHPGDAFEAVEGRRGSSGPCPGFYPVLTVIQHGA